MRGRPRKVISISTGKVGKDARAAREEREKDLKLGREDLIAPAWLCDDAKEEFCRVIRETAKIGILDNLDRGFVAIYANAWAQYQEETLYLQNHGNMAYRDTAYGRHEVESPHLGAQTKYIKQIMDCSVKLGLATTDRLRLIVPTAKAKKSNRYDKFLQERQEG